MNHAAPMEIVELENIAILLLVAADLFFLLLSSATIKISLSSAPLVEVHLLVVLPVVLLQVVLLAGLPVVLLVVTVQELTL